MDDTYPNIRTIRLLVVIGIPATWLKSFTPIARECKRQGDDEPIELCGLGRRQELCK
jgi:hypothetical protein